MRLVVAQGDREWWQQCQRDERTTRTTWASCTCKQRSKLYGSAASSSSFSLWCYTYGQREKVLAPAFIVAVKKMLPYFFAPAHTCNYKLCAIRAILSKVDGKFGAWRAHKIPERRACDAPCPRAMEWNGIRSDRYIETTFMHYGHGPGGIIGVTLKSETLKTWALGLHVCSRLEQEITDVVGSEKRESGKPIKKRRGQELLQSAPTEMELTRS